MPWSRRRPNLAWFGEPKVDWTQAQARKAKVVKQVVSGVRCCSAPGVQMLMGEPHSPAQYPQCRLGDGKETVMADNIVIATGSRRLQVPIPGLDDPAIID